jgi:hypothetical protein
MRVEELFAFVKERHSIYLKRLHGEEKPWTEDEILQSYRFCNVYRELDKETIWINYNWRRPHLTDPDLWFAMVVARMFNWSPTLAAIGYPAPFKPDVMLRRYEDFAANNKKTFTGAYMIRAEPAKPGEGKANYLIDDVFGPMWSQRKEIRKAYLSCDYLRNFHEYLSEFYGMGSFMAGQVVADLKYGHPLNKAQDWWTWAAMGPGSLRGMNRVLGIEVTNRMTQKEWERYLVQLQVLIAPLVKKAGMKRLHNQDLQNCLCEFDKYERVKLGEGRPRSLFAGK